jgi:hypothetical protein
VPLLVVPAPPAAAASCTNRAAVSGEGRAAVTASGQVGLPRLPPMPPRPPFRPPPPAAVFIVVRWVAIRATAASVPWRAARKKQATVRIALNPQLFSSVLLSFSTGGCQQSPLP